MHGTLKPQCQTRLLLNYYFMYFPSGCWESVNKPPSQQSSCWQSLPPAANSLQNICHARSPTSLTSHSSSWPFCLSGTKRMGGRHPAFTGSRSQREPGPLAPNHFIKLFIWQLLPRPCCCLITCFLLSLFNLLFNWKSKPALLQPGKLDHLEASSDSVSLGVQPLKNACRRKGCRSKQMQKSRFTKNL